jgi:hypothetical protein
MQVSCFKWLERKRKPFEEHSEARWLEDEVRMPSGERSEAIDLL